MSTDYHQLIETDWLGQWDLEGKGDAVVQIESVCKWVPKQRRVKVRDVLQRDGTYRKVEAEEPIKRVVVFFVGKRKPWLAGPVSLKAISGMYGNRVNDWVGKRITLYVDGSVMFGKKRVGGIRVRPEIPKLGVTTRTLDQPVDQAKAKAIEEAKAETLGTGNVGSGRGMSTSGGTHYPHSPVSGPKEAGTSSEREPGEEG